MRLVTKLTSDSPLATLAKAGANAIKAYQNSEKAEKNFSNNAGAVDQGIQGLQQAAQSVLNGTETQEQFLAQANQVNNGILSAVRSGIQWANTLKSAQSAFSGLGKIVGQTVANSSELTTLNLSAATGEAAALGESGAVAAAEAGVVGAAEAGAVKALGDAGLVIALGSAIAHGYLGAQQDIWHQEMVNGCLDGSAPGIMTAFQYITVGNRISGEFDSGFTDLVKGDLKGFVGTFNETGDAAKILGNDIVALEAMGGNVLSPSSTAAPSGGSGVVSDPTDDGLLSTEQGMVLQNGLDQAQSTVDQLSAMAGQLTSLTNQGPLTTAQLTNLVSAISAASAANAPISMDAAQNEQALSSNDAVLQQANDNLQQVIQEQANFPTTSPTGLADAVNTGLDNAVGSPANAPYMVTLADGQVIRGTADKSGAINVFLPPDTAYTISVIDSRNLTVGTASGMSSASGVGTAIADLSYTDFSDLTSTLNDGVPDVAKEILGVDPTSVQPIVPGLSNLAAIQNGLNAATVNSANVTGVVGGVALQGSAQAVAISASASSSHQTAYVATTTGLAIVNVTNHTNPTIESQITLGGDPRAIAVDSNLQIAAVASGTGGLQLIDVSNSSNPRVLDTIPINATQVQIANGIVYANDGANLDAFDLTTGQPLQTIGLGSAQTANGLPDQIIGLTSSGSTLFAATHEGLFSFAIGSGGTLSKQGEVNFPVPFDDTFSVGSNLTVSNGIAYIAAADASVPDPTSGVPLLGGYLTVNVSDPSKMAVEGSQDFNLASSVPGARVAVNGSGIGVTIGSAGARSTTNELDVFDASDPTKVNQFITAIQLPGSLVETPSGVALDGTAAFVADGSAGLQIVNYESLANGNNSAGPSIQITSQPKTLDPTKPGLTLVEGQQVTFGVKVSDTAPVTSVQLLAVTTDPTTGATVTTALQNNVNAPFDLNASTLPLLASLNGASLSLEIQATDAAGHVSTTAPIAVTLLADTTPPRVTSVSIADGATRTQAFQDIEVNFSKPINPNSVNASTFTIIGPDGKPLSGATATLAANGSSVQVAFNAAGNLPAGAYQLQIDNANVHDLVGNAIGTGVSTTHFNVQAFSDVWIGPQSGGVWSDAANWSSGKVPSATDDVLVNLTGGGSIFMNSTDQVASLTQIGAGTLAVTEGGSLTVAGEADLEGTLNVLTSSTFNANGASTIGSLLLTGGTLGGTGTVNVTGSATFQGGQMVGTGTTITQGMLSIEGLEGQGVGLASGRTLQADGMTTWIGGTISGDNTTLFDNRGTLNVNGGQVFSSSPFTNEGGVVIGSGSGLTVTLLAGDTQSGSFSGSGSLEFAGPTASLFGAAVNFAATSNVAVGALTFADLNVTLGGTIAVGSGDQLVFDSSQSILVPTTGSIIGAGNVQVNGGSFAVGATSTFAVTGTTTVNNGTISFAGPATLGALDLIGSTLTGSGTVTVTGSTTLAGALLSGSGRTVTQGALTIDSTGVALSGGYVLENQGVANWTSGSIQFSGGASAPALDGTFRNDAGAVFNANIASLSNSSVADGSIVSSDGPATGLFDNEGTFNQLGNIGTSMCVAFANNGSLSLTGSTLTLDGSGTSAGMISVDANSTLTFNASYAVTGGAVTGGGQIDVQGGTVAIESSAQYNVSGMTSINGGTLQLDANAMLGSLSESGGFLTGTGTVTVTGTMLLTGGAMTGTGRTIAQGGITIEGNGIGLDDGRVLVNQGDTEWLSGVINLNPFDDGNPAAGTFVNDVGQPSTSASTVGGSWQPTSAMPTMARPHCSITSVPTTRAPLVSP